MGVDVDKWIETRKRRALPGWMRLRRVTEQRLSPRKARSHKAARLIRQRRATSRTLAVTGRHVRAVQRDGDDGTRCWDCHTIPLKPWEPTVTDWPCGCVDGTPEAEGCIFR